MANIILVENSKIKIGDEFGHTTVIGPVFRICGIKNGRFTQPYSVCVCRCKCGSVYLAQVKRLNSIGTNHCGCLTSRKIGDSKLKRLRLKPGEKRGKLTVLGEEFSLSNVNKIKTTRRWKAVVCRCECGTVLVVSVSNLVHAGQENCECGRKEAQVACGRSRAVHGESRTKLHKRWSCMIERCAAIDNEYYGGRGISVCEEWRNDYRTFRTWALANGWNPELEIDRINTNGNYEPENCRFVTTAINQRNKRSNVKISAWNETKVLAEWVDDPRCSVTFGCLWRRLNTYHWTPEEAIATPRQNTGKQAHGRPECRL